MLISIFQLLKDLRRFAGEPAEPAAARFVYTGKIDTNAAITRLRGAEF
ncbi:hypothetical protein [Geomonas oryzae]|nr:hypothetical protein [Geomonas oryzae]